MNEFSLPKHKKVSAKEAITYLYEHGHIPQYEHYTVIVKEIEQLQAENEQLKLNVPYHIAIDTGVGDYIKQLQAENEHYKKTIEDIILFAKQMLSNDKIIERSE